MRISSTGLNMSTSSHKKANIINNENVSKALCHLLADSYGLYLMTHNFHWNVRGPMFNSLHLMFENQYTELALAIDTIAERIRTLGLPAPGTYIEFQQLSSIKEVMGQPKAEDMIKYLIKASELVIKTAKSAIPLAEDADDQPTVDLLTQRIQIHEKSAWRLRCLLEK